MSHDARVVLITGASSGIGRAVALRAAESGDHVILAARGRAALDDVAIECGALGAASVLVQTTDVGDDAAVAACFEEIIGRHSRIDAVMHCAGVVAYGRTEDVPAGIFDGVLRTNLGGSVNVARHAIRIMRRQEHGTLVMTGSVIGHIAVPTMSPYVLSKWGVRALARQLQVENRDLRGVHIAYVAPGGVDTPIYEQAANYVGFNGRPPPPVASPERVARAMLRLLDRHRDRSQVGWSNNVIRVGFSAMPWVFDRFVGPLFELAATDRTHAVPANTGNVLESQTDGNRLHGEQGNALVGVGRNIAAKARAYGASRR